MERAVRLGIAVAVLLMWCATLIVADCNGDWQGVQLTTPVMMIVCGWTFGVEIIQKRKEGGK